MASQAYAAAELPPTAERTRSAADPNALGPTSGPTDPVEAALARALDAAAAAGRFDVVAQLAEELRARRLAVAGNVVELAMRRTSNPRS